MSNRIGFTLGLFLCVLVWAILIDFPVYAAVGVTEPSLWARSVSWVLSQQRAFHQELSTALKSLADNGGFAATGSLILGSFLYGVFHAAGPGHGKAVLTTYLLTHPHRVGRGVGIAAASAFCQGLVAIILVYGLIYLAGWVPRETSTAVAWSERLSFFLVAAIGALLVLRTCRQLLIRFLPGKQAENPQTQNHGHDHGEDCGHNHMPTGEQLEQIRSFRSAISVVLAIGLRPCTGAVLVLVLARALSLPIAGVGAVIAMSAGTGMAVALIAFLAVSARQKASAMTVGRSTFWRFAGNGLTLVGGGLLLAIGISLLSASFYSRHPLGL